MPSRMGWREFWPYYLREHADARNRALHIFGTTFALAFLVGAAVTLTWWFLLLALFGGYLFAWMGHLVFEKNRPATFEYPLKSFAYDWRMWAHFWTGRLGKTLRDFGIEATGKMAPT